MALGLEHTALDTALGMAGLEVHSPAVGSLVGWPSHLQEGMAQLLRLVGATSRLGRCQVLLVCQQCLSCACRTEEAIKVVSERQMHFWPSIRQARIATVCVSLRHCDEEWGAKA